MKIILNSGLESDGPLSRSRASSDGGLFVAIGICCNVFVAVLGFLFTYVGAGIFFIFDRNIHLAQESSVAPIYASGWHLYPVVPATSNGDNFSDFVPTFGG